MAYFDYAATTKPLNEILELYTKVASEYWANPSSMHLLGAKAMNLLEKAQGVICEAMQLQNKKVIFTTSATEANNIAIQGICKKYLGQNKTIITSSIEHPSVSNCFEAMKKQGFNVIYIPVDADGIIDLAAFEQALSNDVILVSIMWVNNIIGSIQPIEQVINLLKGHPRIKLHVDIVQGLGKIIPQFAFNDCDFLTFSGHKLGGIKGTGALIINDKCDIDSPLVGSSQQYNLRPGTIDVAGAVTLAKIVQKTVATASMHYQAVLQKYQLLVNEISKIPNIIINGGKKHFSPYILNLSILGANSETLMHYLEAKDIYVGTGSACNSKIKKPEKTVLAISDPERALSTIRVCLDFETTDAEITELINALKLFWAKNAKVEVVNNG